MSIAANIVNSMNQTSTPTPQESAGGEQGATSENSSNPAIPPVEQTQTEAPKVEDSGGSDDISGQDPDFARRFNMLTRKEKQIQEKQQEINNKYSEIQEYQKERAMIKEDPVAFLEKHGWKFNDLAEFVLNDKKKTPESQISELQKRLDAFEEEKKTRAEEEEMTAKQKKEQELITNFKKNIEDTVKKNLEEFELVNQFGEYETVYQVIENYYNEHEKILDIKEAAQHVEKYLEGQLEKASGTKKFQSRFHSALDQKNQEEGETRNQSPTLSNDSVTSSSGSEPTSGGYLPYEESLKRSADIIRKAWASKNG